MLAHRFRGDYHGTHCCNGAYSKFISCGSVPARDEIQTAVRLVLKRNSAMVKYKKTTKIVRSWIVAVLLSSQLLKQDPSL